MTRIEKGLASLRRLTPTLLILLLATYFFPDNLCAADSNNPLDGALPPEIANIAAPNLTTQALALSGMAMLPFAIPGLANLWLITTKDTALLAVVGFSELALETKQAAGATKAYFLFYSAAGLLYLCLTLVSNVIFGLIERRYRRGQPAQG